MQHNKEEHKIKVSVCWNYQAGNCEFQDDSCWFAHKQTNEFTSEQFKCNNCQLTFKNRPEYLGHRKLNHMEMVPICKNIIKGKCEYSEDKCWFNHQRISKQNKNETETFENNANEERIVLKKLLDMVEKITEISNIKIKVKTNNKLIAYED